MDHGRPGWYYRCDQNDVRWIVFYGWDTGKNEKVICIAVPFDELKPIVEKQPEPGTVKTTGGLLYVRNWLIKDMCPNAIFMPNKDHPAFGRT